MKVKRYLAAVIRCHDRYLIMRPSPRTGHENDPFFFPGSKKSKFYNDKIYLAAQLDTKYAIAVRVRDFMGKSVIKNGKEVIELYAYYCELRSQIKFNRKAVDYRFANSDNILSFNLEPNDRIIAERLHFFKRVYDYTLPSEPASRSVDVELSYYVDALNYFGDAIDSKDREDLYNLIVSRANIRLIRGAYLWVLKQNNLDYNEHLRALEKERAKYKKKHRN